MRSSRASCWVVVAFLAAALLASATARARLGAAIVAPQGGQDSTEPGERLQAQIEPTSDETAALLADYGRKVQELERLQIYNTHIAALLDNQRNKLQQMEQGRARAQVVERDIVPLMTRMVDNLARFVPADLPILVRQRSARLQALRDSMGDADIATAEKYRQIVEAYKAEIDLGRRLGTYRGELERDGITQVVNFLHLGRVLLAYQTEDRSVTAFWNPTAMPPGWEDLPEEYRGHIDTAMRVADRQAAPVLLRVPVPAPAAAR